MPLGPMPVPGMGAPTGPPGPVGGATVAQPMAGAAASAMSKVRDGYKMLMEGLSGLPMGSDLQLAVVKAVGDIGKHLDQSGNKNQSIDLQTLIQQVRQAAQQAQAQPGGMPVRPPMAPGMMPGATPSPAPPQLAAAA